MRRGFAARVALLILLITACWPSGIGEAATCGRSNYPDASNHSQESVEDPIMWDELVSLGGFANASEARGRVRVFLEGTTQNYTITLEEEPFTEYVGSVASERVNLRLHVLEEGRNGSRVIRAFEPVNIGGRAGGNLTVAAHSNGTALVVFWRWAYLECDETFLNSYYVFRSVADPYEPPGESELVYFEAPRPRRAPPADLVLLVVAGIAVSIIFLFARHALKRKV